MGAIIKAINTNATSRGSTKALSDYLDKEKSLKTGIDCNSDNWEQDFSLTKTVFSKTEGRQYKHFAQSFEKDCKLTAEEVHKSGLELVENCKQFKGFQAVVITHLDKDHLHNHIVINSVNSETGKKLQLSNSNLKTIKNNMNKHLKKEFNLEPIEAKKGIIKTQDTKTYKVLEKALEGKGESFILNLTKDVKQSLENSIDQENFKENLNKKNIGINISKNHETVLFTNPEGKKISSKKIAQTFGLNFSKKILEKEMELNKKCKEVEKIDYTEEMLKRTVAKEKVEKELKEKEKQKNKVFSKTRFNKSNSKNDFER